MRSLAALLLPLLLAAAPPRDWSTVATRLPNNAFLIGNPAARVKLVEYASYTCPHCAAFAAESDAVLRQRLVRAGTVSWEVRHQIHGADDLAAVVVARCTGPRGFAPTTYRLFAEQQDWAVRAYQFQQTNATRLGMYPLLGRLRAIADGAGLTTLGRSQGLSDAQLDACFADEREIDRITALSAAAPPTVTGTPTFFVNGRQVPGAGWATLQPALAAVGAK